MRNSVSIVLPINTLFFMFLLGLHLQENSFTQADLAYFIHYSYS